MHLVETSINVAVSFLLGSLIGAERQWRQRLAGLRTNTLVCVGSTLFVTLSMLVGEETSPTRVAAQVVSGIGFLGAGVIFKEGLSIRGLNTAATLWCSAAVGVLAGGGFLLAAGLGTVAVLAANMLLRPFIAVLNRQPDDTTEIETHYRIELTCHADDEAYLRGQLLDAIDNASLTLQGLWSEDLPDTASARVRAELNATGRQDRVLEQVVRRLSREHGVSAISWESQNSTRSS